jgi:RimJ/RimL family protein N-acetyltransferase
VVFTPILPIRTQRLELRLLRTTDFADTFAYQSRQDVARYLYQEPRTAAEYEAILRSKIASTGFSAEGDRMNLAIVPHDVGHVVGDVMLLWASAANQQGEIGFVVHPDFHGRGYAHEAAEPLLGVGFDGLRLHRIYGRLDARNTASARVLEKLGMRREAHLVHNEFVKGEWTDELIYAILRTEWSART